ncbi:MAG: hypothetical protein AB7H93_16740 [Vicinamibacterales bacterium]
MELQNDTRRFPEFLGLKLPAGYLAALRRAAEEDDRTVSAYLRRLIRQTVKPDAKV